MVKPHVMGYCIGCGCGAAGRLVASKTHHRFSLYNTPSVLLPDIPMGQAGSILCYKLLYDPPCNGSELGTGLE